jgi:hypothetical protein
VGEAEGANRPEVRNEVDEEANGIGVEIFDKSL